MSSPSAPVTSRQTPAAAHDAVLRATRDLLWVGSAGAAREVAVRLVHDLGGIEVPADIADADALPVDLSFGDGPVLLASAGGSDVARMLLERHLPGFVRDVHRALELGARSERLAQEAEIDSLTGLATRRVLGRALGRLEPHDVIVLVDLDHFKKLNDSLGHSEGDRVLRVFGRTLSHGVRVRDVAARYGGEEFVLVLTGAPSRTDVESLLDRLRTTWENDRPHAVTFSAGITQVGNATGEQVVPLADAALYVAKQAGRDRWRWADANQTFVAETSGTGTDDRATDGFVAWSRLTVPAAGHDALIAAFRDRLGAVDHWPGFRSLEVWADESDPTCVVMVSWWDDEQSFRAYMGSDDHRRSHARIPGGDLRPRGTDFQRFRLVST